MTFTTTLFSAVLKSDVMKIDEQEVTDTRRIEPNRPTKQVTYIVFDTYDHEGDDLELRAPADQLISIGDDGAAQFVDLRGGQHRIELLVSRPLTEADLVSR